MIPAVSDRIDYGGSQRLVIGRLSYSEPPEPGTLIGPNAWGETCVVLATVDGVTLIGLATQPDVAEASAYAANFGPRSPVEDRASLFARVGRAIRLREEAER